MARPRLPSESGSEEPEMDIKPKLAKARAARKASAPNNDEEEEAEDAEEEEEEDADGDGEDGEDGEMSDGEEGDERGKKRFRTSENGGTPNGMNGVESAAEAKQLVTHFEERDEAGYVPGSIVRVAVKNFVTYNAVEFFPGPRLNMVIGPNGSGKSTIVCAIALGLGYPPSLLGRQGELKQFVKHGAEEGWTEIEIKARKGKKNVVIRRFFSAEKNSSQFTLNGEKTTAQTIAATVSDLNIQVNNLCSFLPQDKVSSFAQMNPIELLRETQRAGGHAKLNDWHETLIEDGKKKIRLDGDMEGLDTKRRDLERKIEGMRKDVDRFNDRQQIENRIKVLELARPFAQYAIAKAEFEVVRKEYAERKALCAEAENAHKPFIAQQEMFTDLLNALKNRRQALEQSAGQASSLVERKHKATLDAGKLSEKIREDLELLNGDERNRKAKIARLRAEVDKLQQDVAEPVEEPDLTELRGQSNAYSAQIRDHRAKMQALQHDEQTLHNEISDFVMERRRREERIKNLKDVNARRDNALRVDNENLYRAVVMCRKMREAGVFVGDVYDPIRLQIAPVKPEYGASIEYSLDRAILETFVCTHAEDYDKLMHEIVDKGGLRINAVTIPNGQTTADFPPPMSRDDLQKLGFNAWVTDLLEGPDAIRAYLCHARSLHTVAIAFNPNTKVNDAQLQSPHCPIRRYIVGPMVYTTSFSAYGNREAILKSYSIGEARVIKEAAVDENAIRELEREIDQISDASDAKTAEIQNLQAKEDEHRDAGEDCKARKAEVNQEMEDRNKRFIDYKKAVSRYETAKRNFATVMAEPSTQERKTNLQKKLRKSCVTRMEAVVEHLDAVAQLSTILDEIIKYRMRDLQVKSDHSTFKESSNESSAAWATAQEELEEVDRRRTKLKAEAMATHKQALFGLGNADPTVKKELEKMQQGGTMPLVAELESELDAEHGKLSLTHDVSGAVIQSYQRLNTDMEQLNGQIDANQKRLDRLEETIQKIKSKWKPHLDELITAIDNKFDSSFKRMGCLGHVVLTEDEDYAKWGIEIQVSFRDDQPLFPLTASRQSGGERSLSTIMYLMSLTELAKAPFTLVDEINQGMDQRAERAVHDQLVQTTCQDESGQAWLITPKLLPDLRYDEKLKVLCICNGDWLPETFSMRYWIDKNRKRKGRAGS